MRALLLLALGTVLMFSGLSPGARMQLPAARGATIASGGDAPFLLPKGDVVHFISPTGRDGASGLTPATAWATPNHSMHCGDVIIAVSGVYTASFSNWGIVSNCPSTTGGIDGTGGINFAVLLCAGPDLNTCPVNSSRGAAFDVIKNNWAVEGFNITAPTNAVGMFADACNVSATQHHVAFINNLSRNSGYGFTSTPCGNRFSSDYLAVLGNIIQNANGWTGGASFCGAALDINAPHAFDANAGTHIFVSGNFVYANTGPVPIKDCTTDIEGMMADAWDGLGGYTQQSVWSNNIIYDNAGWGFHLFNQRRSTTSPTFKIYNNTFYDNGVNIPSPGMFNMAELDLFTGAGAWIVTAQNNLIRTGAATAAGGTPIFAVNLADVTSSQSVKPNITSNTLWGTAPVCDGVCAPSRRQPIIASCCKAPGYVPEANNYTDPLYTNTTDLLANWVGAPNCSSFLSTDACLGWNISSQTATKLTPIGDLIPTATGTSGQGYQGASMTCVTTGPIASDYPAWLKGVVYLHWNGTALTENAGLVTKPCGM